MRPTSPDRRMETCLDILREGNESTDALLSTVDLASEPRQVLPGSRGAW